MNRNIGILIALVIIVGGLGTYIFTRNNSPSNTLQNQTSTSNNSGASAATYSLTEISQHSTESDCWTTVNGNVYNITSFIPSHPGGRAIIQACGKDGTSLFKSEREHQEENAEQTLESTYLIGTLKN